ncbi:YitT family protein [Gallaecimonas sp. GXIMD4217]|uniref:YitT family protein n=1 Tax=Gallaecimonas sp. GXIMD4217 TaxID=3131927 RepID=UPI00311B3ADF
MNAVQRHSHWDDLTTLLIASAFVSLGVFFFKQVGLLTGGTAGLALLLSQLLECSFGQAFFLLNLPFFYLGFRQKGLAFSLKTFAAISLVSLLADSLSAWLQVEAISPLYSALMGGGLIGVGMLMLFRHQTSLGGINLLVLHLQEKLGISAGRLQLAIDSAIIVAGFFVVSPWLLLCSVLGAVMMNLVLMANHKPGRYLASSC